jgi:Ser/Thr protein kinase RdoA (MazF antagonist)
MGPWSPAVHAYLRHLEKTGFAGAPRVLEVDGDTEVLSYVAGEVPSDPDWEPGKGNRLSAAIRSDESLTAAAVLLRELHEAGAGFTAAESNYQFHPHPPRAGEVMSHGDLGPWNTVYRDGLPVAFIDWDACQPVDPVVDVATAAWAFVPLEPDRQLAETGFDPLPDLGERLRLFFDSYGELDRSTLWPALIRAKLQAADRIKHWQLDATDSAVSLEFFAAELRWLGLQSDQLRRALS